jgi:hypothetical protein
VFPEDEPKLLFYLQGIPGPVDRLFLKEIPFYVIDGIFAWLEEYDRCM